MKQNASIKDIAERLHLSVATVSLTLSGRAGARRISAETQERVRACAEEMNYRPNLLARALISGQTGILGLIIPDITDSFFYTIARKVELEAERQGYSLMIASSESDVNRESRNLAMFQAKGVDGIIIAPTQNSENTLSRLVDAGYPLLVIDRIFTEVDTNSISVDNAEASRRIVKGLIADGAHNIAMLTFNPSMYTMAERRKGYDSALREAGMEVREELVGVVASSNYEEDVFRAMDEIYRNVPEVDAFFFATHQIAIEAFRYFKERKISIGDGKRLGCIHLHPIFNVLAPKIRVAYMPVEVIGARAVDIIVNNIRSRKDGQPVVKEKIVVECTYPTDTPTPPSPGI